MNWNETLVGKTILERKYYHEGEDFNAFLDRVSGIFSDDIRDDVRDAIKNADLFPAGRTLFGAGNKGERKSSISNCYICTTPKDNIESIWDTAKEMARIYSYGGGCGVALDNLRPKNALVNNASMTSTGAVSFMNLFDVTTSTIGQHGRRGALMICLPCNHPDIYDFLQIKKDGNKLESANISIKFTDDFMKAVLNKEQYTLRFVTEDGKEYSKVINAYDFFRDFCETQYDYGDPGAIFIDRVRNYNLLSGYEEYQIDTSNPCSEFFGNAGNSCLLASINLYHCVLDPFKEESRIDYGKLYKMAELGVKMLNETMDYGYDMQPLDMNRKCIDDWRSIGLGVFGLADMLVALGVKYGSKEAQYIVSVVMNSIFQAAVVTSCELAKNSKPFGKFDLEKTMKSPLWGLINTETQSEIAQFGLRNGSLLSIAPTGSIATMAGESGGVEPFFAISYERTTHSTEGTGQTFKVYSKGVEDLLAFHNLKGLSDKEIKNRFPFVVTAYDILPLDRVAMQSAMQQYVDNAISSTVNLPHEATVEQIEEIYKKAWKSGLKGITVFRDGCKRANILGVKKKSFALDSISPPKRRDIKKVHGMTFRKETACIRSMYITVNSQDGKPFEVFTNHSGGCQANIHTISRLAAKLLQAGVKTSEVIQELKSAKCQGCLQAKKTHEDISDSCGNAIADAIAEAYDVEYVDNTPYMVCPECGEKKMRAVGKCTTCDNCGYSKCD